MQSKKRQKKACGIARTGGVDFQPDDSRVAFQRQHCPIPKVLVEGYKYPAVSDGAIQNLSVIRARLTYFRGSNDIVPFTLTKLCEIV
jgi:hypothetical protein